MSVEMKPEPKISWASIAKLVSPLLEQQSLDLDSYRRAKLLEAKQVAIITEKGGKCTIWVGKIVEVNFQDFPPENSPVSKEERILFRGPAWEICAQKGKGQELEVIMVRNSFLPISVLKDSKSEKWNMKIVKIEESTLNAIRVAATSQKKKYF